VARNGHAVLKQNGVKTSRARVAEYGRIVLDGGKKRNITTFLLPTGGFSPLGSTPCQAPSFTVSDHDSLMPK
jgi:hypothetical protein